MVIGIIIYVYGCSNEILIVEAGIIRCGKTKGLKNTPNTVCSNTAAERLLEKQLPCSPQVITALVLDGYYLL